jgi:hypothetical protein
MKSGDLSLHLEAYLALKKALGFPLGARERLLRDFVAFAESSGTRGKINAQVACRYLERGVAVYSHERGRCATRFLNATAYPRDVGTH